MHRRVAVIAEGNVVELQLRGHRLPHRHQNHRPERGADGERGTQSCGNRHAQDGPGRDLRRMRRGRPVSVPVAVAMVVAVTMVMMMGVGLGWNHACTLYYNITCAKID